MSYFATDLTQYFVHSANLGAGSRAYREGHARAMSLSELTLHPPLWYHKAIPECADVPTSCPSVITGRVSVQDCDGINGYTGSWDGTYEFDRVTDAIFVAEFDAGEKRITNGSAWIDLRGIIVDYDADNDRWEAHFVIQTSGAIEGEMIARADGDECAGQYTLAVSYLSPDLLDLGDCVSLSTVTLILTLD